MHNPFFFERHPGVVGAVQNSDFRYVIIGPGGWIGRATVEYLADLLGETAVDRLLLLGSSARKQSAHTGIELPVRALAEVGDLPQDRPCVLFHYAFLTMDKVGGMSEADYTERNYAIREQVVAVAKRLPLKGMLVPSSGAVYDLIAPRPGRDPAANFYGRLKYEDEFFFEGLARGLGISHVCPRVFNLSGPYINKPATYALASLILDALQGRAVSIRANRPVVRAYMPVQTLIEASLLLFAAGRSPGVFDYAGGVEIEVGALARQIIEATGNSASIVRPELDTALVADRYVGNGEVLTEIMREWGMATRGVRDQIMDTVAYLRAQGSVV